MHELLDLVKMECLKIGRRPRSYIGFAAIAVIVGFIQIALYVDGNTYWDFLTQSLSQTFEISGWKFNGNMVAFIILQTLIVQMPLLVTLVSGDLVSGESQSGTLRYLLVKPVSRTRLLIAKFIAGEIYTLLLIIFLGMLAWLLSLPLFGIGDIVVLKSDELVVIRGHDTTWRFLLAFLIAFLSLSVVHAFAFMLSVINDNSITPIVASMSVIILFTIIGTFDIPMFDRIKPFLFTTHTIVWRNLFDAPPDWPMIMRSVLFLFLHIIAFMGFSIRFFNKKDYLA